MKLQKGSWMGKAPHLKPNSSTPSCEEGSNRKAGNFAPPQRSEDAPSPNAKPNNTWPQSHPRGYIPRG
jgi:hypothetical protein